MRAQNLIKPLFVVMFGLVLSAQAQAQDDAAAAAELRERISTMVEVARCNNIVNCRILELGSRPCGGPEEYIAFSTWDTFDDEINAMAAEYDFLMEEVNADSDIVGTCEVLPKPGVNCVQHRCVLVPAGS